MIIQVVYPAVSILHLRGARVAVRRRGGGRVAAAAHGGMRYLIMLASSKAVAYRGARASSALRAPAGERAKNGVVAGDGEPRGASGKQLELLPAVSFLLYRSGGSFYRW